MIDLGNFERAIAALREALRIYATNHLPEDAPEKRLLRDGSIFRFGFAFELCWKTLRRYLAEYGLERVDTLSNRDLFRAGFEQGLLQDPAVWFHYLKMRNLTSHVYQDSTAHEVFLAAHDFLRDAGELLQRLQEKTR